MLSRSPAQSLLTSNFEFFFSGSRGRKIGELTEQNLLFEISQHYPDYESTRALADALPNQGRGFLLDKLFPAPTDLEKMRVSWKLKAYDVLSTWVEGFPDVAHSLSLLRALERTKPEAAQLFQDPLTCGKYLSCTSYYSKTFLNLFYCPVIQ